jgi:hypothetical protein
MPIPANRSCSTAIAASTWWTPSPPALPTASVFLRTASATGDTSTAATEETRMPIWQPGTYGNPAFSNNASLGEGVSIPIGPLVLYSPILDESNVSERLAVSGTVQSLSENVRWRANKSQERLGNVALTALWTKDFGVQWPSSAKAYGYIFEHLSAKDGMAPTGGCL